MDRITALYRSCNPTEVLPPGDLRNVDCSTGRNGGVAKPMAKDFMMADPEKPLHRMFTGHLGVGKSTELQKLKEILTHAGASDVIYFDVSDELDGVISQLQISDLDVLIARHILSHFKTEGIPLENSLLTEFSERFRQFLRTEIAVKEITLSPKVTAFETVEIGIGEIVTEIKEGSESSRQLIRNAIAADRSTLRKGLDDILSLAREKLKKNILIIIDGVEKIPSQRHEEIFINGAAQLVDLSAHVLFTIPMQLTYHPRFSEMRMAFAQDPSTVPMIHPDTPQGMACLREILATRCDYASQPGRSDTPFTLTDVFETDALCDYLCRQSGGHVRQLLIFIQAALARTPHNDFPINADAIESALRDYRIGMTRQISSAHWPWLRHFKEGKLHSMPEGIPDDIRRDIINQLIVFEYINGDSTYDVSPEIRKLAAFKDGDPA
jgi:hypothetical protein